MAEIVQSTLRLPKLLWAKVNKIADSKNLSMQQAVQQAVVEYCEREQAKTFEAKMKKFERTVRLREPSGRKGDRS